MSIVTPDLLRRYDVPGPRYTSYPTADRFVEAFREKDYIVALQQRKVLSATAVQPLSLYIHIPFCESLCYYCACNKIITKDHGRSAKYLKYLAKEIEMQAQCLEGSRQVTQLHLGGGTPTFLAEDEMRRLMAAIRAHFQLAEHGEFSIEVDPRLAHDTENTAKQAVELWEKVNRPNAMIKIPATLEGLPAITATLAKALALRQSAAPLLVAC